MRRTGHIFMLLLLLLSAGCKVDFDLRGLDSKPILCLDMHLAYESGEHEVGEDSYVGLNGFVYAVPSAAGEREFPEELRCLLEVYRNAELVWTRDDIMLHEFEGQVSAQIYGLTPGDELKVVARAEGFPTAYSEVTVPQNPPQMRVSHTRINQSRFRLGITIEDDPKTEDHYAFWFLKCYFYEGHLQPSGVDHLEPSLGTSEQTTFLDTGPFEVIWQDGEKFYGLSDRGFNGQTKTIEINVDYPLSDLTYDNNAYYKVGFCRISQERLRYETACRDKTGNVLGFMGLAPATFSYTNVIGGAGCISCANGCQTDWILVPSVENLI